MSEILSAIALAMATLVATVGVVLFIILVLHWGHKREHGLMPYIFYPTFLIIALTALTSGRNLYLPGEFVDPFMTKHPLVLWLGRTNSIFILLAACERIAQRFLYSGYKPNAPVLLLAALWLYFLTNIVSSVFLGAHSSLSHEYLYSIFAGTGALLLVQGEADTAVRAVRNTLFIFIIASALILLWRPEMVITLNYRGLIPSFNVRYYGLSSHPNSFGPLSIVFLMCLWNHPFANRWLYFFSWTIGITGLVLTQSKTSWAAFAICALCMGYFHYSNFFRRQIFDFRQPQFVIAVLAIAMLTTAAIGFVLMFSGLSDTIYAFFTTSEGEKLLSLSGRDQIWAAAIQEWQRYPVFGYGLNIWDEYHRAQIGIPSALHAHSQFHQSLSSAGVVGVIGLLFYVITLLHFALKTARPSLGLSIGLIIIIMAGALSEIPLTMNSLGPDVVPHLLLLMLMASHLATQQSAQSNRCNFAKQHEVIQCVAQ
jgi:O-antigen ligase